jgi:hypothetical protein
MRPTIVRFAPVAFALAAAPLASAQTTPPPAPPVQTQPPGSPGSDDTPSIRLGATIYADYTYQDSPAVTDTDGNSVHVSQFNIGRSYINVTGNISHIVAFRITPDIVRSDTAGALSGNLVFRIKYAYAQFNLDEWLGRGTWTRFGIQQTPWVDFQEGIYRYRFQGTVFSERDGFLSSSDAGASFHYNLPSNAVEVHVGVYNGENYNRAEVNGQKAFEVRGSVRPFTSGAPVLRGLRVHVFYDGDSYVKNAERRRTIGSVTFEHKYVNAGYEYLNAKDQTSATKPSIEGKGYSVWATPKSPQGWEALLRYDHLTPNDVFTPQVRNRTIAGVAYWFPHQGNVATALLVDYDGQTFDNFTPALPKQTRIALHGLINF